MTRDSLPSGIHQRAPTPDFPGLFPSTLELKQTLGEKRQPHELVRVPEEGGVETCLLSGMVGEKEKS